MGQGWTLSVDIRSTAGGVLKSSGAPVRSVPVNIKERNSAQLIDPNVAMVDGSATQPAQAVLVTDAGGKEVTNQRDVDGIITTPPWDKNLNNPVYEEVIFGGSTYQILVANEVITPDGTIYTYTKQGAYTYGQESFDGEGIAEPSNILKISTVTDRHGNVTEYHYKVGAGSTNQASFAKANGNAVEQKLDYITMPNGHRINFVWGTGPDVNRVVEVNDHVSSGRAVIYEYTDGMLTSVTTPAGKETTYDYANAEADISWTHDVAANLLTEITDPRGLTTTMTYAMRMQEVQPYGVSLPAPVCMRVIQPNDVRFYFSGYGNGLFDGDWPSDLGDGTVGGTQLWQEWAGSASSGGTFLNSGRWIAEYGSNPTTFTIKMFDDKGDDSMTPEINGNALYRKTFDTRTQDLILESQFARPYVYSTLASGRKMVDTSELTKKTTVESSYNFMGNPLEKTVKEYVQNSSTTFSQTRSATVSYAYWGEDKYYQQKAIKDQAGRYSFTDYYDSSAATGKKGQTYRVYDQKRVGTWGVDSGAVIPDGTDPSDEWKYNIIPADSGKYSAEFDYDSKGRPIDVWKIQSTSGSPWTYVQTHTTYGADNSPHWGQAYKVVEDYGSGKINRTTTTNSYTNWGTANCVTNAAGVEFTTVFDEDGQVQSVYRTDGMLNDPVVTYTYGSTPGTLTYGMPTKIVDELSGTTQDITYASSGGGLGQVSGVAESDGGTNYTTTYTYGVGGERATAVYSNSRGTIRWKYSDYIAVGDPSSYSRVFQTVTKLDGSSNPTAEEFHYSYDPMGRLRGATFAMTPADSFTPTTGNHWYDGSHLADKRARAFYEYDAGGRTTEVSHWWESWDTTDYDTPEAILATSTAYELSSLNRGLKTSTSFYSQDSGNANAFDLDRTETYSYDADLDYLTGADYNDGLSGETPSWSYDAAGNRNDASVVDNLNRATTIGGVSRTYDILGNTLTKGGAVSYGWDVLNRMTSATFGSDSYTYKYRADGMRVQKLKGFNLTSYMYDGQMPVEELNTLGSTPPPTFIKQVRHGLGARGIDWIEKTQQNNTVITGYPVYDGHGNMIACLFKSGGSYALNDQRSYDAWGNIRAGNTTGDPKARYVANLGHLADDESGLTYMRARYYEPSSGRFVSEDPAMDGGNWFTYCGNNPVSYFDANGKEASTIAAGFWDWAVSIFKNWGIELPLLPKSAQIVINTIATVELLGGIAATLDGFATGSLGASVLLIGLSGTPFAWVPSMLYLASYGARFLGVLFRVAALATFAQCAMLLYIDSIDTDL